MMTRVRFTTRKLLDGFTYDIEDAMSCERKREHRTAYKIVERGRRHVVKALIQKHGFARVAKHMTLIDRVLTRHEARVRRSVER